MGRFKNLKSVKGFSGELHLWLGVLSSMVVVVVCLSGTLLLFEKSVKSWAYQPQDIHIQNGVQPDYQRIISSHIRSTNREIARLIIPTDPAKAVLVTSAPTRKMDSLTVYYNPYTAQKLGEQSGFIQSSFAYLTALHRWLLVENPGRIIVSTATIIFIVLLLTGIVLWWPRRWKSLKRAMKVNTKASFKSLNYQLHNVLGFYGSLLLLIIAFSGLYIGQEWLRSGTNQVLGESAESISKLNYSYQNMTELLASDELNRSGYIHYEWVPQPNSVSLKAYKNLDFWNIRIPDTYLIESVGKSLKIVQKISYEDKSRAERYAAINRALHTGEVLGWPGRLIYFLVMIFGTSLPVTGLLVWLNKFRREPYGKNRVENPEMREVKPEKSSL